MPTDVAITAAKRPAQPPAPAEGTIPEFEIRPRRGWVPIDFKELFHYRELLYFLIWRDVKVRYKQTLLGFAWAILQPLVTMVIATAVFGGLAGFSGRMSEELIARHVPYNLFVYAGLLPWMLFSVGISTGGTSLMNQQNLLTKVYFPRLFVPASVIGTALVDTAISFGVFFILMAFAHVAPPWTVVFVPLLLLLTTLATMGIAFVLSSLTVTYRDFRFILPFMMQCWMFLSPVYYPLTVKKAWEQALVQANPLYGLIEAFRSCLLGQHWKWKSLSISVLEIAVLLLVGLYYFKRTERRFADIA
ncbi:MAG: ABC transporter permease [Tepidisphaeraceae bacterium]|jgi:lipopolysaccharide transport system permease protein